MSNLSYCLFPSGEIVTGSPDATDDEQLDETTPTNNVKFPGTKHQQAMNMDVLVIRKYRIRINMVLRIFYNILLSLAPSLPLSLPPYFPLSLPLSISSSLFPSLSPSLSLFPDTNGKLE